MSSNSSKKNTSSGLRILWIPGRKSHPKGRLSSTKKHISYSPTQKKSEVWSLGGSKAQTELIELPLPDNNGASTSSVALLGEMSSTLVKNPKGDLLNRQNLTSDDVAAVSECATLPTTPIAAISPNLNSPLSELSPSTPSTTTMTSPIVVTKVEILELQRTILNPDDLPKVPATVGENDLSTSAVVLNSSDGTTASITTNSSPLANRKPQTINNESPHKNRYRNHNNNQDDINSIRSISSFNKIQLDTNFEWIDEIVNQRNSSEMMHKNKRKKSKRATVVQELDQVDGRKVKDKHDVKEIPTYDDNDEKVVKCLYYSLMCCDCTIS